MIKISNLTKNFDGTNALDNFSLQVNKGSIYGLVGLNGAGKTTAIKHLAGVFQPDTGEVLIDGIPVYDNEKIKARVGYISDDLYFFPSYNLQKISKFYAKMYKRWSEEIFRDLTGLIGLDLKKRVGRFSKGMQKQAALVLTFAAKPDVLLLDEPIDGLDPIVRKKIFDRLIEDVADRQLTVLISSHNLKEMDGICDTVGIIKNGRILIESDIDELKAKFINEFAHKPPTLDEIFVHIHEAE